ncbi:hypothetical protein TNIN_94521 [Trichonephila inaurata madagascariensis]|uniref:Uncharacterized protein n=1 Tax=Trichonephila inaurata madagascariensis TaxID=2747483 RepID=A0A8X6X7C9_9ARAC|nr:hypothetical protein TNIN_94521 [Trichonephila inaurata madagascariensis]
MKSLQNDSVAVYACLPVDSLSGLAARRAGMSLAQQASFAYIWPTVVVVSDFEVALGIAGLIVDSFCYKFVNGLKRDKGHCEEDSYSF